MNFPLVHLHTRPQQETRTRSHSVCSIIDQSASRQVGRTTREQHSAARVPSSSTTKICLYYIVIIYRAVNVSRGSFLPIACEMRFIVRSLCVAFVVLTSSALHASAKMDCKTRLMQCESKNARGQHRKVCGTDNKTYSNRCALLKIQCSQNSALRVKHRGRCKEKQPCWMDQGRRITSSKETKQKSSPLSSLLLASSSLASVSGSLEYMPECLADGSYAPIQCHKSAGYCWCVTPAGRVIPGTSVHKRKPNCPRRGKGKMTNKTNTTDSGETNIKGCNQIDRSTFVNNFVRILKTEYNRYLYSQQSDKTATMDHHTSANYENRAIIWKYQSLDKDGDKLLTKNEYKDLKKLVRKFVKPKKCSRVFIQLCDTNKDSTVSEPEWNHCLTVNKLKQEDGSIKKLNNEDISAQSNESEETGGGLSTHLESETIVEETIDDGIPLTEYSVELEEDNRKKEIEANDCLTDRKAVLEELKLGNQEMYLPECTPDGRYKKIQCYKSTGYCWCVLEDSGKPIPGTSAKDSNPKCESMQTTPRPMKDCPENKKVQFTKYLLEFFRNNFSEINISSKQFDSIATETYEHIASSAFNSLDTNKNKVLDRKEWKNFRKMVSSNKLLRRCGRKLPRYCDVIHDNKITLTEWLNCLNIQNLPSFGVFNKTNEKLRRRGPNPLESYLKGDD